MAVCAFPHDASMLPLEEELPPPPPASDMVKRGEQRHDLQNPDPESPWGKVVAQVESVILPIAQRKVFPTHRVHSRAVAFVPPGEPPQPWHCDMDGDRRYHTLIVPLTTDRSSGGTEFGDGSARQAVRGCAYSFNGALYHRGGFHGGKNTRIFAMFVLVPLNFKKIDPNIMT